MLSGMSPAGRIKQPVPCVQLPQATPMPGTTTGAPVLSQGLPMAPVRQQNSAQPLSARTPMAGVKLAGGALKQAKSMQMGNVHRAGGELGMALASLCASCTDSADAGRPPGLNLGGQSNSLGSDVGDGRPVFDKSGGVGGAWAGGTHGTALSAWVGWQPPFAHSPSWAAAGGSQCAISRHGHCV